MKLHFFTNFAQLLCLAVSACVSITVYLYLLGGRLKFDQDLLWVGLFEAGLCGLFTGLGLKIIRRNLNAAMKSFIAWSDILISGFVVVTISFVVFIALMSMGLGLVILNPILGWLSTLQNGLVLVAVFAGFSAYLSVLASMGLVYPFLFSLHSGNLASDDLG